MFEEKDLPNDENVWDRKESAPINLKWVLPIIFFILLLVGAGWGYMFMAGEGLYYHVDFGEYAIEERACNADKCMYGDRRENHIDYIHKGMGIRFKGFRQYWLYNERIDIRYGNNKDSIKVIFNDGVTAEVGVYLGGDMPFEPKQRILLHQSLRRENTTLKDRFEMEVIGSLKKVSINMSGKESLESRRAELVQDFEKEFDYGSLTEAVFGTKIFQVSLIEIRYDEVFDKAIMMERIARNEALKAKLQAEEAKAKREALKLTYDELKFNCELEKTKIINEQLSNPDK